MESVYDRDARLPWPQSAAHSPGRRILAPYCAKIAAKLSAQVPDMLRYLMSQAIDPANNESISL